MTLIAFAVQPDRAEICTDTLTYAANGRTLGRHGKVHPLPHLNSAMLTQGAAGLAALWAFRLSSFTEDALDFDDLDKLAAQELPATWDGLNHDRPGSSDSIVFHVGFSPAAGRFLAYGYPSINRFRRADLTDRFYAMPALLSHDPAAPADEQQWTDLARLIRRERALAPIESGHKVFIGGDVVLTRIEVGCLQQRTIHTFDDTGLEFRQMVAGTLHPFSQLGPCPCGSGKALVVCHGFAPDSKCTCGSGRTFGACCRVDPPPSTHPLPSRRDRREAARRSTSTILEGRTS